MKPQSKIETLPNGVLLELIKVEGGKFMMGSHRDSSAKPIHEVQIQDFYIGKYPITNQQFLPFLQEMGNQTEEDTNWVNLNGKYKGARCGIIEQESTFHCVNGLEHHPMIYVSSHGAKAYCKWLSEKANQDYRLPTEAEWEYAAKGGKYNQGFSYAGSNKLKEVAWYNANSHTETKPVGLKLPNKLGLFDMSGNIFEWCSDCWHSNYERPPIDEKAWEDDIENDERVVRGGSWYYNTDFCHVSFRNGFYHINRNFNIGFRIARY